mgnify:FL=1
MAFEKYTGARRTAKGAMVTIRKTGQIAFNSAAASDMGLTEKPAVVLFYDKDKNKVGIKPVSDSKQEGARKLGKVGRTRTIAASSFLKFFGIDVGKNLKVEPDYDKKADMIVLDLSKATPSASKKRKGRGKSKK